jgi:hypothetical protein
VALPERFLTETVIWRQPGSRTDARDQTIPSWSPEDVTDTEITAWIQPSGDPGRASEPITTKRDALIHQFILATNELGISGRDRIVWNGATYTVDGHPGRVPTPRGPDHAEMTIRRVEG